ncbi:hypothetical protein EV702DRAFT_969413, partial [Suillus placidus]
PTNIPFINLSEVSSALSDLEMLEWKWWLDAIHWRHLEDKEFQQLVEEHNEKLETDGIVKHCHQTHLDKGKKWACSSNDSGRNNHKKAYKSAETIDTDDSINTDTIANANSDTHSNDASNFLNPIVTNGGPLP